MNVEGIKLCWIVVKDLESAIQFYTNVVGLKLMESKPEFGWAELEGKSGCRLGISQENLEMGIKAGKNAITTITVDDIDIARNFFLEKGVELVGEVMEVPGQVKMQGFQDVDGNNFQLVQDLSISANIG